MRVDALDKLTGRAVYAADVELPGLCHAAVARSVHPHARIVEVDLAEARTMPGVIAAVSGADLPLRLYGRRVRDVPVLARDEVRFAGERVAAVVAETRAQAERAAGRIQVEYKELPAVLEPEQASELQGTYEHGDEPSVLAAYETAPHRLDQVYTTPTGHQGYIEPQACVAAAHPDGRIDVWIANKSPYRLREQLAACFEMEPASIVVHPVAIGGDFGGKGPPMDAPLAIELARLTGRPVKLVQRYWDDLQAANPRHPARIRVRLGCDEDGRLTALDIDALLDGGAYAGFKPRPGVTLHGLEEPGGAYRVAQAHVRQRIAYTNSVPRGHMRAPGSPQATFALESALDELAAEAGLEPAELRRRNLVRTGEANAWGVTWEESRGAETLAAALSAFQPKPAPEGWLRGKGLAVYERGTVAGRPSLRLLPTPSGGLLAQLATPEPGPGGQTVARQALARALDLDPARIEVEQVATGELPGDDGVGASRVTGTLSFLAARAAEALRCEPVTVLSEPEQVPEVTSFCVQVAQVAVDPESGQVKVLEVLSAVDVAEIVNPAAHRMQIEGGAAMGYGFACLEDLKGDFHTPTAEDVPAWATVLVREGKGVGALNVKSVGEVSNSPTAAAIANAVAAACGARVRDLPITAEKVRRAL